MVGGGGRRRPAPRVCEEGGPSRPFMKEKSYGKDEEEQLCRSVLHVTQNPDRIVGNQERAGDFWEPIAERYEENRERAGDFWEPIAECYEENRERAGVFWEPIAERYEENRPAGVRPQRSNFTYEHCRVLVRDHHPRWADGWSQVKPPAPKRKRLGESGGDSHIVEHVSAMGELGLEVVGGGGLLERRRLERRRRFLARRGGTKAAKEDHVWLKHKEDVIYAQARAMEMMAEAQVSKARVLQDRNVLFLMTINDTALASAEAREYLQLRRAEELKKLKRRLAEEEEQERAVEAARTRRRAEEDAAHGEEPWHDDDFGQDSEIGGVSRFVSGDGEFISFGGGRDGRDFGVGGRVGFTGVGDGVRRGRGVRRGSHGGGLGDGGQVGMGSHGAHFSDGGELGSRDREGRDGGELRRGSRGREGRDGEELGRMLMLGIK